MNLGHLLSSVYSSGKFLVTQVLELLCTKLSIFYDNRFLLQNVGKVSHTDCHGGIMAQLHFPGSGCKSRPHYLSAKTLLTVCSPAWSRVRRAVEICSGHRAWLSVSGHHWHPHGASWYPHHVRALSQWRSEVSGWHPAKTICSQSKERKLRC